MIEAIIFGMGLILTVAAIPLVKWLSFKIGYIDRLGDDALKIHTLPVPHSGGVVIFGIFAIVLMFLVLAEMMGGVIVIGLLTGAGVSFALGVWDDLKPTSSAARLGGQILAGLVLIFWGPQIDTPYFLGFILTLFYVMGGINAVNLQDGIDGLAGGMVVLSLLGFALLANRTEQAEIQTIIFLLAGVVVGFLIYNFNPASIFMGDGGSYFLGFVLAYLAISYTGFQHWGRFIGPILIIGVPVLDTALAIFRRIGKGVSPFSGDRSHFYDLLIHRELTVKQTVLIGWALQALIVGFGVFIYQ